jgi:hypothetical protein
MIADECEDVCGLGEMVVERWTQRKQEAQIERRVGKAARDMIFIYGILG